MVELSDGLEGYGKLGPRRREEKPPDLSLSKQADKTADEAKQLESKSDLDRAEDFYGNALEFVTAILNKVAEGKEAQIHGKDIRKWTEASCDHFLKFIDSNDLARLVFQKDEYKDNYLYTHSVNVCFLSLHIACKLNFSRDRLSELLAASLFHDTGMMKVPINIWNKNGRLNSAEYGEVQKHALYGEQIFKNFTDLWEVVPVVIGQHHERSDGTGYPGHLKRDDIHYLARLISLVDRYEAQTHSRLWRPRFLPDETMQQILDNEANTYDPHFMKAMLRQISMFPAGSWVKVSSGEIGNVVRINEKTPMRPVIDVVFDREKRRLEKSRTLDLSKQLLIYVERCVNPEELQGL